MTLKISEVLTQKLRSWSLLMALATFLTILCFFMLNFLSPLEIGPHGILIFFTLLYLLSIVVVVILLKLLRPMIKKRVSYVKSIYLAAAIAFAPVILLALNTLNQLQFLDIALVLVFEALALFYIFRRLQ